MRYHFECSCSLCKYQEESSKSGPTKPAAPGLKDLDELFQMVVARSAGGLVQLLSGQRQSASARKTTLPSRVQISAIPPRLQPCLTSDTVKDLSSGFQESMHGGEWDVAVKAGAHVLAIYTVVYGWRHPLTGESARILSFSFLLIPSNSSPSARSGQGRLQRTHRRGSSFGHLWSLLLPLSWLLSDVGSRKLEVFGGPGRHIMRWRRDRWTSCGGRSARQSIFR